MAESVGSRLNFWKTKPMRCLRSRVRSPSDSEAKSTPSITTRPSVARVSPPSRYKKRGLARARGAHNGDKLSRLHGERNPCTAVTGILPAA
jgi:hypothetical protein